METTVVVEWKLPFPLFYTIPLADFHFGAKACAVDVIDGYIDWIAARDNAFTILNGDLLNGATKTSTPELFDDLTRPDDAYDHLRARLMPIRDKILMITRGGHEEAIYRAVGVDYMARLAYDLGNVPYRPDGGMVSVIVPRREGDSQTVEFLFYATHGWGGARTIGAKVKKVDELAVAVHADVYILSHDHTQNVHRLNRLEATKRHDRFGHRHLIPHRQLLINTGGFLKYEGYVARKGYSPQDLGTPRVRCEVKRSGNNYYKDLHASI